VIGPAHDAKQEIPLYQGIIKLEEAAGLLLQPSEIFQGFMQGTGVAGKQKVSAVRYFPFVNQMLLENLHRADKPIPLGLVLKSRKNIRYV
jgi:hypothetical protein